MELTKNTSVDPAKMIGKNYIEAVNAKFPNTILDEEWSTPNQVTLTLKLICYLMWWSIFTINMKAGCH